jgi:hypothetical protein
MSSRVIVLLLLVATVAVVEATGNVSEPCVCPTLPDTMSIVMKGWENRSDWNPLGYLLRALDGIGMSMFWGMILSSIILVLGLRSVVDLIASAILSNHAHRNV